LTGTGGTAAASALDDEADVEGGLDPELIASFIKSRIGEILYCYERQLSSNPNLYGKVGVRFIIGATGAVDSTRILQSSLQNAAVEGCITQKISKWKFPTPKGGTQVVVTYPFIFKNTN
jgi:TonB family protein